HRPTLGRRLEDGTEDRPQARVGPHQFELDAGCRRSRGIDRIAHADATSRLRSPEENTIMITTRTTRTLALAGTAVALTVALSGCNVLGGSNDAQRDEEGNVTEGSNIDVFSLQVGDCMPEADTTGEITDLDVVPCS